MADKLKAQAIREDRRRHHVRSRIRGTAERPRLSVCKSLRNTMAQLIDDQSGVTVAFTTTEVLRRGGAKKASKTEAAKDVGRAIAGIALEKGIKRAVFDRNRYIYHGRVKAVADGAREGGLEI